MDIVRTVEDPKEAEERSVCLWSSEKDEKEVVIFMKMENGEREGTAKKGDGLGDIV